MALVNNASRFCFSLLVLLLVINSASAAVDVTYYFNQPSVNVMAFNCLNQNCSSVSSFAGQIIDGPSVSDGSVVLRYPDSLATAYGYAEFFTSDGFRPLVGRHDWHTFGSPEIRTASQSASFSKVQGVCSAVAAMPEVNSGIAGTPVSVSTIVALAQATSDAFRQSASTNVDFIPAGLLQSFWGADVIAALNVLDSNSAVVYSEEKVLSAANNNALFSNSAVPLSFVFTPANSGSFTARITSRVVDSQCSSGLDTVVEKNFVVAGSNSNNGNNSNNNNSSQNSPPQTLNVSFTHVNGTLNNSFVVLNATSDSSAGCRWSLENTGFGNMGNSFNSTDGLSHNTRIAGMKLGNNSVFVACNGQNNASVNYSLSFFVENILDGSSLSNSTVVNSSVINSVLNNSSVFNSNITNSGINNALVNNAVILDNIISSGEITINNLFYNASSQGSTLVSRLVPSVPVVDFVPLSKTVELQGFVSFGSTSTDVDVGGPLNDSLSFFWNFGDGTNSTAQNFNKAYSQGGDYVVSLKVTDRFNLSSTKQSSVKVLASWPSNNEVESSGRKRSSNSDAVSEVIVAPVMKSAGDEKNSNKNPESSAKQTVQKTESAQSGYVKDSVIEKSSRKEAVFVALLAVFNLALFSAIIYLLLKLI